MAIPENYIDKITKDGESRDICPAADKVRVGNENFDGTNLDDVLNEIAEEIENAGDGTVTGVKVGDTTYNPDSQGVVDLSTPFANKVDKETGKGLSTNDYTTEEKTKLAGLPTNPVQSISVNGQNPQTPTNGNVNIQVQTGSTISPATASPSMDGTASVGSSAKYAREDHVHPHDTSKQNTLTFDDAPTAGSNNPVKSSGIKTYVDAKATITGITTSQDGTFTIALSDGNSYTVNLNHVHPQYLKYELLADEAAYTALATKDSSTLYLIPEA